MDSPLSISPSLSLTLNEQKLVEWRRYLYLHELGVINLLRLNHRRAYLVRLSTRCSLLPPVARLWGPFIIQVRFRFREALVVVGRELCLLPIKCHRWAFSSYYYFHVSGDDYKSQANELILCALTDVWMTYDWLSCVHIFARGLPIDPLSILPLSQVG